jgi:hypothetical protein
MYIGIHLMSTVLALSKGLSPFHIILVNPNFPLGGLSAASKTEVLEHFKRTGQFLPQVLIPKEMPLEQRRLTAASFIEDVSLPVAAKPDRGVVGIGVRRIDSLEELNDVIEIMPCDYMLQEFCDYPLEYGIFYCRYPNREKGRVVSLTRKLIPTVIGDGQKTVRELIDLTPTIKYNKNNLLAHAKNLNHIPAAGERHQVIDQASHTYGCIFRDNNHEITPELDAWMNAMSSKASEFYFGRFDMKLKDKDSLRTGRGVKICELNGCWSEPAHIYDDKHSLGYAIKEMFRSYRRAYKIAKLNQKRLNLKVPYKEIIDAYRSYMQDKEEIIRVVG